MMRFLFSAAASIAFLATAGSALAGPSCAALAGKSFVFRIDGVRQSEFRTDVRIYAAAGRFRLYADGRHGTVRYFVNSTEIDDGFRAQDVECEGDDGIPPRLIFWRQGQSELSLRFRPGAGGDLVLTAAWPGDLDARGDATPLMPGGAASAPCTAFAGRFAALIGGRDAGLGKYAPAVSDLQDYVFKAGKGSSAYAAEVVCTAAPEFGPGAARLTFGNGVDKTYTSGYVAAASRDRIVYVDETPGRATTGWFHRQR